jgi:hypothetical protein
MADRNGYIGRAPGDSSVTVARQTFSPTGITTDFTFASGYTPGYFDIFINGAKMIEGSDYTSTDGSTFAILNGGAIGGDVIEGVAYKAFNAATATIGISSAGTPISTQANTLNFVGTGNTFALRGSTVDISISGGGGAGAGGTWSNYDGVTGVTTTKKVKIQNDLEVTGVTTSTGGFVGNVTGTATGLSGTPDITIQNLTGVAATFTGVLTYEDVTNVDSVGLVTARSGLRVVGGGLTVTGVSTFFNDVNVDGGDITFQSQGDKLIFSNSASNPGSGGCIEIKTSATSTATIKGNANQLLIYNDDNSSNSIDLRAATYSVKDDDADYYALFNSGSVRLYNPATDGGISDQKFETTGNGVVVTGIATADFFYGDGSNLTNLPAAGIATAAGTAAGIVTTLFLSSAQDHKVTASGITTITVSGGTEADSHTVRIINSGITTVGFSTYFLFPSGSTPSLPTADGAISLISFTVNRVGAGGTQLLAGASLNFS